MSQSNDIGSQPVTPASNSYTAPQSQPTEHAERTFRQSEVTDIVKRAKAEAFDSYKRMQNEQPQYFAQKFGETGHAPSPPNQQQNTYASDDNRIRQLAAEEAHRLRDDWIRSSQEESQKAEAQRTVQQFWAKIGTGKQKYQDFEQVTGDIQYGRYPNIVQLLAHHVENSDDLLYELGKDRLKMSGLEALASKSPDDAIREANRLAKSLRDNQEASKVQLPNAPLSQMRPSNGGTDNGALSVKDYRRKYKV